MSLSATGILGAIISVSFLFAVLCYQFDWIGPRHRRQDERYWQETMELAGKINPRLLNESLARYPQNNIILRAWCQIEVDKGIANAETHRRIQRFVEMFPGDQYGFMVRGKMLISLKRDTEAEAVLEAGMKPMKKSRVLLNILSDYAKIAGRREDWSEAIQRWRTVQKMFPNQIEGFMGEASADMKLRDYFAAETAIERAIRVAPGNDWALWMHAYVADQAGVSEVSIERWAFFREMFDSRSDGYTRGASACYKAQRYHEGQRLISQARILFANDQTTMRWCNELEQLVADARA